MGVHPLHSVDGRVVFLSLGLTEGALHRVVHVDADLQVNVGSVSREDRVGPVSQGAGVAAVEQNESSNE